MKFRSLIILNAVLVSLAIALVNFYFQQSVFYLIITFISSLIISFCFFYFLMERYIYSKIKIIYKLIHHLKLGKDLKDSFGEQISRDPIGDVQKEVREWAIDKKEEIDALKNQEKFRREFLSNISHEFKTPLFAIQGYIDALQDGLIEEDPLLANSFLNKAANNLDRLSYLIKDIDEISKLESGELPINFQQFDIILLINEVLESLELKAQKHKIKLVFKDKLKGHTMVFADREKIRQVLINLISNSIKYSNEDGKTTVRIFELHDQILVEVADNGIGIDEKNLPRIFERFFRTEKSRAREIGGSGLGLSIVKHIMEAHQQTISVRSKEGVGSTFGFTLEKK